MQLFSQIKNKKIQNPVKDIVAGIIVALVSIPIGMGYAQIAGLPAVYGLYGSLLPIFVFGFFTTSPLFVVGVDAMPAVMVGGILAGLNISAESPEALKLVPVVTFLVAVWFVIFAIFKVGRVVKYISTPVMGGFISGVGITIILMQIPKLFGGSAGTGEALALLVNIYNNLPEFNAVSFVLGFGTVVIILLFKKISPKLPMTVIMLVVGAVLQVVFHLDNYGVKCLAQTKSGLPGLVFPDFSIMNGNVLYLLVEALSIAAVIMAQTLLATGKYAAKYGDEVDNNKELIAYAAMNIAGMAVGSCPINGSVSRSGIADSFGAKSQLLSVSAAFTMLIVLLFGTPLLSLLPVPILTGIVMTALIGIVDKELGIRLYKTCRNEFYIFILSMLGVLVFGTVGGVLIGCALSFAEVAVRAVTPPTDFLGRIPGHGNFHSLSRNSHARPIENTVIYRFSGNLFFANIDRFEKDILEAIKPDTRQVVIDARGIGSIDITALDRIISLNGKLKKREIRFYITEHASSLNDQIRRLGGEALIDGGTVRRTISLALRDAGLEKPYHLEGLGDYTSDDYLVSDERLAEFEWAFGGEAQEKLAAIADELADEMIEKAAHHEDDISVLTDHGATTKWGVVGLFDEMELWDHIEERLEELVREKIIPLKDAEWIEKRIEKRREAGLHRLHALNPKALEILNKHRENVLKHFKEKDPQGYEHLLRLKNDLHRDTKGEADDKQKD